MIMDVINGKNISVCLLTYNHVNVIESTMQSIQHQTIDGYEIIVSDNCSWDGTWEKILEMAATDSRIKPHRTSRNLGMEGNYNHAVSLSNRPYIALLHHDDIYRKDLLEKWLAIMEEYPDVGFVFNAYGDFQSSRVDLEVIPGGRIDGPRFLEKFLFSRWGCPVRGTTMMRRAAWDSVGGVREQFGLLADVDLWMRLSKGWAVGYVPEPVITVRHERPSYYPDIFTGKHWSWRRQRYLYEIHAANRLDFLKLNTLGGRFQWWGFRLKLSIETIKWLGYAVVRKKPDMITSSHESVTQYDLWPLRVLRSILMNIYSVRSRFGS
jgi:GT2 family glycosyltransferase